MICSVGIDPGAKGAIAILQDGKIVFCEPHPFIGDEMQTYQIGQNILTHIKGADQVLVAIEAVHAMPGQGVTSMFHFGENYGELRGLIKYLQFPFIQPTPQKWKKVILEGLAWKGDKEVSCEYVANKYPTFPLIRPRCRKPHDGMADAICMAEFAMRQILNPSKV